MAFHYNANHFEKALNRAAGFACSKGSGGVDAYIVCSLFGGTGSGTFLDVSYNVRKVLQGMGFKPDIIGCFVIGARTADRNMQSSCYAALQELEYFMSMGIHTTLRKQREKTEPGGLHVDAAGHRPFEVHYPIAGEALVSFDVPPVDVCYLFGATNSKELIFERNPLEEMVAKRIFFELMPGIGVPLQAKRVDIMNQPSYFAPDRLQERAKTFFSTSNATIEFPAPQIQNALASGLAAYCCYHALFKKASGLSDLKGEVNALIEKLGLSDQQMRDEFEKQDSGTVTISINDDKAGWKRRMQAKIEAKPFDKVSLEQEILKVKKEAQDRVRVAEDTDHSGIYVQTIRKNADKVWKHKEALIAKHIGESVGDKTIGPTHTEGFISALRARLAGDMDGYDKMQSSYDSRMRQASSGVDRRIERIRNDLSSKYTWELSKHAKWLCEKELAEFLNLGKERTVCKSAWALIHKVNDELERLQARVENYAGNLKAWGQEFTKNMLEVFKNLRDQADSDPVNQGLRGIIENMLRDFPEKELKWEEIALRFYDQFMVPLFRKYNISNTIANIDTVSEEMIKEISGGEMGNSLFQKITSDKNAFKSEVFDASRKRLDGIRKVSVCDLLLQLDPQTRKNLLEEKKNKAAWLLQVNTHDETINHVPELCEKNWIGVWQGIDPVNHAIWKDLTEYDSPFRMASLPEPYRMVFVSEIGVFSLRNVPLVEEYKRTHDIMTEKRTQNTHKKINFPDIFPPSPLLRGIHLRAESAGLLGRILGFLKEEKDPNDHYPKIYLHYSDKDTKTRRNQVLCKSWGEAAKTLRDAQEKKEIAKKSTDITALERLELEIHAKCAAAKTRDDREALWRQAHDYLASRLAELGDEKHPFYQNEVGIVEDFGKRFHLH
jgi:hypothetical protein